jgi:hypothetical protein
MSAEANWLEALGEGPEREKAVGGLTGLLFWTGGLAATGLGVALALGERITPEVGWVAKEFAQSGVSAGPVIACGTLAMGFAWITRLQRRHGTMVARGLDQGLVLSKLAKDLGGLRENIARVQLEFAEVQQTNRTLLNLSREQATAAAQSEPTKDAMFRLAASMDQLGARLESRVRTQFDSLEKRVADFDRRLEETSMIQRSELAKLEERITVAATLAQSTSAEIPYVDGAPEGETTPADQSCSTEENPGSSGEASTTEEPVVELQPREEWLEITVELEENGDEYETPGLFDLVEESESSTDDANDNWFEEATRNAGMVAETEDLLDAGEPTRLSPACDAVEPVEADEMLEQLDSLFGEQESVAEVLENLRRRRGE